MNFPFYIAKRYVRSKSTQNAVNVINFITFLVIVIGSAALFIVLSGFAGLKTFSLSFTNAFDPDLKAVPATGKIFSISPEQEQQLSEIRGVAVFSKEIEERVYLRHREQADIASIKGVDDNYITTTGIDSMIYYGEWNTNPQYGVAGIGIINKLNVTLDQVRNPLRIIAPKPGKGSISIQSPDAAAKLYNELPLVISGIFQVEESLDNKYVFIDLELAQALLEKNNTQVSGVNFKIMPEADLLPIRERIKNVFGNEVILKNRQELNGTLYRMLNTEQVATYLIFTLVLIIALFNVVGAIIMMILDKQQNSKTLYNLGVTVRELRRIYFVQGILVTTAGGFIGVLLGSLLIGSQLLFGWVKIGPIDYPVELNLINVLIVLATIIVLGIIASKIASSRINKKLVSAV
ncbi:ABC transporter permease [Maribacter algarum]|uniref:ABC transporter permease n=1 Tax=Maribacter algarum (ex Zhang et al. 2020) TaxID=2578118 RepID=A0A5S3QMB4_9FLAO|nr:FtsX-like permease family protein [Maribacter algarum]TMM59034.1 ABC transporter permease [Maribacter algarum]